MAESRIGKKANSAKLNKDFIMSIDGKDFVTYQGLLDLAHQKGLSRIEVEIVQFPNMDNEHLVIARAVAETNDGGLFSDYGDASPANCNGRVARHLIRMASTRAKARVLRDLTNVGMTALEELADIPDQASSRQSGRRYKPDPAQGQTKTKPDTKSPARGKSRASAAQQKALANLASRQRMSPEDLSSLSVDLYGVNLDALTQKDAASFIKHLQQAA